MLLRQAATADLADAFAAAGRLRGGRGAGAAGEGVPGGGAG